ncbi:hypothetical protein PLESTB_001088300 [Pleodorina starrii]|uniref:Uncharacterized protein n=1 Tax=Pleodorina starrii TaxID=330485 RepID=A0A9W6BRP7_9CHLO|nr:hypothetical protein PLESTB_001088300 [Pleodorina starrii]
MSLTAQGSAVQRLPRESIGAAAAYERDPELQAALDGLLADLKGRRRVPKDVTAKHVERIERLGCQLGLNRIVPAWNDGAFRSLVINTADGVTDDDRCSLARLTFGQVGPADLMVQLIQDEAAGLVGAAEQLKGPLANDAEDPARGYAIVSYFRVLSNGVVGKNTVKAVYELDEQDPSKLHFTCYGIQVQPASPDPESLALWREALGGNNPGMGPDGAIFAPIEFRPRATIRYILMEPNLNLAVSQMVGGLYAMQRVPVHV